MVDPLNGGVRRADLAISEGRITEVGEEIPRSRAREAIDVGGYLVFPGLVDCHVHIGRTGRVDKSIGHRMLAKAGVTTAIDFGTTVEGLISGALANGAGLNVGGLFPLIPGLTLRGPDPTKRELEGMIDRALEAGALGMKIMGGHSPLTPDATARAIELCNERRAYVAFHVGTTRTGSDLRGLRELGELLGGNHAHVAHINSYCRGLVEDPLSEVREALEILEGLKGKVVSESHLARINGTSGRCSGGEVEDHVTRNCLRMGGYPVSEEGLRRAIAEGYAAIVAVHGGETALLRGEEALEEWERAGSDIPVSFTVTPPESSFICAVAKGKDGRFIVDALATDGGFYPRNFLLERGLALVELGALTLEELVLKISSNPARMFGLMSKGHLSPGADADVTVVDPTAREAVMSVVGGIPVMVRGVVLGKAGTVLVTDRFRGNFPKPLGERTVKVREGTLSGGISKV